MIRRSPIARRSAPKRKKAPARRPKAPRKRLKAECDRLFSLVIRARDGECRLAGTGPEPLYFNDEGTPAIAGFECRGVLQCAHLFSRRYFGTRWDVLNAWTLCAAHHVYYTHRPIEWDDLLREHLEDVTYSVLRTRARREPMPDLEETRESLKWLLSEYERMNAL